MLACTQSLVMSLPSLGGEGVTGPDGVITTLRQVSTVDPAHYPEYESPLVAARQRLRQRRRAEDAVSDAQVMPQGVYTPGFHPLECYSITRRRGEPAFGLSFSQRTNFVTIFCFQGRALR